MIFHVLVAVLSSLSGIALFSLTLISQSFFNNVQPHSGGAKRPAFTFSIALCILLVVFGAAELRRSDIPDHLFLERACFYRGTGVLLLDGSGRAAQAAWSTQAMWRTAERNAGFLERV